MCQMSGWLAGWTTVLTVVREAGPILETIPYLAVVVEVGLGGVRELE